MLDLLPEAVEEDMAALWRLVVMTTSKAEDLLLRMAFERCRIRRPDLLLRYHHR